MNVRHVNVLFVAALLVAGCAGSPATPSSAPTPPPSAAPTPPPAPTPSPTPADFAITILPDEEPLAARVAIPGEKVSFLVIVKDAAIDGRPVDVGATAVGGKILDVKPASLKPGAVGEVWVVPDATSQESMVKVSFSATRDGVTKTDTRSISIMPMADERAKDAQPYFERWIAWLAAEHPEIGISATTKWEPTFVSTFLVVSHYAYFSDEWELKVSWHNMIPPYDWTEIYLRHRGDEWKPSLAYRIDSVKGKTPPHAVTPPDAIMR